MEEKTRGFEICKGYEDKDLTLPIRSTKHSVCYDICSPEDITIPSLWNIMYENFKRKDRGETDLLEIKPTKVKSGIKAYFQPDEVMIIANRSSGPSKKGLVMSNDIGIFECDYYGNIDNDGNIIFQFYNFYPHDIIIKKGERMGQAYFQKFLITDNDNSQGERVGGIGSTGR